MVPGLDGGDRNLYTGAEFPVRAIVNPRMAAFTLPALSTAEARNQHRDMLRRLGAALDMLWIAELTDSMAERNRRAIWGAMNAPGDDAAMNQAVCPDSPGQVATGHSWKIEIAFPNTTLEFIDLIHDPKNFTL